MVPDKDGSKVWYIADMAQTVLQLNGSDIMLFGKDGIGYAGSAVVVGTLYRFDRGNHAGSSERSAGKVEMDLCGADPDDESIGRNAFRN